MASVIDGDTIEIGEQRIVVYGQGNFRTRLTFDIASGNGKRCEPRISLASALTIEIVLDSDVASEALICDQADENQLVTVEIVRVRTGAID